MKRPLVTGARGFVGRHCLAPALAAGLDIWATTSSDAPPPELASSGIRWRYVELLRSGTIEGVVDEVKPTHALHLAWETTHGGYWTSPANLDWLAFGARFIKSFAACGGERFVAAGTCAEYDWNFNLAAEDVTPERPSTFYGRIKLALHQMLMQSAEQFGFSAATGRIFFTYGPHENTLRLIPYICRKLVKKEPPVVANSDLVRDFMHVEDVAAGFVTLLQSEVSGPVNISSGEGITLGYLAEELGRISGRPDLVQVGHRAERSGDIRALVGRSERLRELGWNPKIPMVNGLSETYNWWQTEDFPAKE